jgi:predicted lactoylglutathione lyase
MSVTDFAVNNSPIPTITRAGTRPQLMRRMFVNIAVADLQRSIRFFEALGFSFNRQLTDASAACMLVGTDAFFMLLSTERFVRHWKRPLEDSCRSTRAFYTIGVESRQAVGATVTRALECGATRAADPQDHGYMYIWSFYDLDGHYFEVFWMDPVPFSTKIRSILWAGNPDVPRSCR